MTGEGRLLESAGSCPWAQGPAAGGARQRQGGRVERGRWMEGGWTEDQVSPVKK